MSEFFSNSSADLSMEVYHWPHFIDEKVSESSEPGPRIYQKQIELDHWSINVGITLRACYSVLHIDELLEEITKCIYFFPFLPC